MDGIHDTGGLDGYPHPDPDGDDPLFRADWERIAFTLMPAMVGQDIVNMHEFRHGVERMGAIEYLETPYYEHWLASFERLLQETGHITDDELEAFLEQARAGTLAETAPAGDGPDIGAVLDLIEDGKDRGVTPTDPRFEAGDEVVVRNNHPRGHTRCPDYARRATGRIETLHGSYLLPDANAHGEGYEEPVYSVAFEPEELWGDDAEANETILVDLWESYLAMEDSE